MKSYKRKKSVQSIFVAISMFGSISRGGIAEFDCTIYHTINYRYIYLIFTFSMVGESFIKV